MKLILNGLGGASIPIPSNRFLLLSFSVLLSAPESLSARGHCYPASFSATGEFRVGEDATAVEGVRVLRNVRHLDVVLGFAQLLGNLGVNVVLCVPLSSRVEVLSLVGVSVLLARPHHGVLLSGDLEDGWVEGLNHWVGDLSLLIDHFLGLCRQLVVKDGARLKVSRCGLCLHWTENQTHRFINFGAFETDRKPTYLAMRSTCSSQTTA